MIRYKKAISIVITIIVGALMAFVTLHSLWVTVPFLLCMIAGFDDTDNSNICLGILAITLDVIAFVTNVWFGVSFLLACILLMVGFRQLCNDDYCIIGIVLFNIGNAICGEFDIFLYVLPSIIAIFLVLWTVHYSCVDNYLLSKLPIDEQIKIAKERYKEEPWKSGYEERIQELKNKKVALTAKSNEERARQDQIEFRKKYVTEDMERIEKLLGVGKYDRKNIMKGKFTVNDEVFDNQPLPSKIFSLQFFNDNLQKTINEYVAKADNIIGEAYKSVLRTNSVNNLFWNYGSISQQYYYELNPVVAAACDASVKKISAFVQQKQDIINKNNADIAKYNQLIQKLQKQYDDELALQKIKELNKDVNSQMEDISDIENKEIKNSEFQSIISDIDLLDKEVNERRQYEIQFGQIEI